MDGQYNQLIAQLIAIAGIVVGPVIAYFVGRRRAGAEVLLIDIETIKSWSEQRKAFEQEIAELHAALALEQDRRRADRDKHNQEMDEIRKELAFLRDELRKYTSSGFGFGDSE